MSFFFPSAKITSSAATAIYDSRWQYDSMMNSARTAYSGQALRWLAATAAAALTTCCWPGWAPTPPLREWCFWCWWCGGPRRPESLSRFIPRFSAHSCFDYFFLPPLHTFRPGRRAGMGGDGFVRASCVVVSRLSERARRQAQQAEQRQADVERLYALSQEMMLFEDAERLLRDLPGADRPHLRA